MCKKAYRIYEEHSIDIPIIYRVLIGVAIICLVIIPISINTLMTNTVYSDKEDTNVYLDEEICYAGGIYIKADSISVSTIENQEYGIDEEGDSLSKYTLNIGLYVQRRGGNIWTSTVKLKSEFFTLKSVNLEAKSKMAVFFECLAKETISAAIGMAVGGSVNIIEETVNYLADYSTASIENVENSSVDFKPIKGTKKQFEPFKPSKTEELYEIGLSFPVKQEYMESKNLIVLSIDQITHFEQRIFLTKRPI